MSPALDDRLARKVIAEHLGVPLPLVVDCVAFADLGADSLDLIELTMVLEQEFDVRIADDEAQDCITVGEALDLLRKASEFHPSALRQAG